MKMKRFFAIFAIIAVLCTFCTVTAMADNELIAVEVEAGDTIEVHQVDPTREVPGSRVEPTCTEDGKVDLYCTTPACAAENLWHTVTIPATGHDFAWQPWGEATELPTCQHGGTAIQVCKNCGETGEVRDLAPLDHEFNEQEGAIVVVDQDDCKGYVYHLECAYGCGTAETEIVNGKEQIKYYTSDAQPYAEGPMKGELKHDWTDWSVEVEPTCCKEGTMTRACVICGAKQAKPIEKLDHTYEIVDQHLAGDCHTITITWKCSDPDCDCQDSVFEETITGNFHKYVPAEGEKDSATCTAGGTLDVVCKYCGDKKTIDTKALGHDWSEWTLEKTFMKDGEEVGYYTRTCERCGAHEELVSAESPITEPETPPVEEPDENIYAISTIDVAKDAAGISGTGQLLVVDGDQPIGELYARTAFLFENEAGEQLLVVNTATVKEDGSFKVPSVKAPFGYTLKSAHIVAINDEAGMDGAWAPYAVCDPVIL